MNIFDGLCTAARQDEPFGILNKLHVENKRGTFIFHVENAGPIVELDSLAVYYACYLALQLSLQCQEKLLSSIVYVSRHAR